MRRSRWLSWVVLTAYWSFLTFSLVTTAPWEALGSELWAPPTFDPTSGPTSLLLHFVSYAILTVLVWIASPQPTFWLGPIVFHAALTEMMQAWVPGRWANLADFAANVAGVAFVWLIASRQFRRYPTPV